MLGSIGVESRVDVMIDCGSSGVIVSFSSVCAMSVVVGWVCVSCNVGSGSDIWSGVGSVVGSGVGFGRGVRFVVDTSVGSGCGVVSIVNT